MNPIFIDPPGVWALKEDPIITPKIIEQKSFDLDHSFRDLPEYQKILKTQPNPVAYDIGAFIGYISHALLQDGWRTVSFEPYPDAFSCLTKNLCSLHPNQSYQTINAPVGDGSPLSVKWGHMISGNPGTRQTFKSSQGDPSVNLDDWICKGRIPPPNLIKIDVEGNEPAVLKGASTILKLSHPTLLIEIYPNQLKTLSYSPSDIFSQLDIAGYQWRTFVGTENSVRWDIIASTKNPSRE